MSTHKRILLVLVSIALISTTASSQVRRRTAQDIGQGRSGRTDQQSKQQAEITAQMEKTAETIADTYPNNCAAPAQPTTESALRFYPPFSPTDSVEDAWCGMQRLRSSQPIYYWLKTNEGTIPLIKTDFTPDGSPKYTKGRFVYDFVSVIQRKQGADFWRATKALSELGVPSDTPEASYRFLAGDLVFRLDDVDVMGIKFRVEVIFTSCAGLIAQHFAKTGDYLHVPLDYGKANVGFPWALSIISLVSEDPRIAVAGPEIKKALTEKYARFVKERNAPVQDDQDPTHVRTVLSDGAIRIIIHEGTAKSNLPEVAARTRLREERPLPGVKYLQINYVPEEKGQYDKITPGAAAFSAFVKTVGERRKKEILNQTKQKNPF